MNDIIMMRWENDTVVNENNVKDERLNHDVDGGDDDGVDPTDDDMYHHYNDDGDDE